MRRLREKSGRQLLGGEGKRERKRDRREKVGTQEGEEKGDARVDKVVMDA